METLLSTSEGINLTIPLDLYDSNLVKKLVSLLKFRELSKGIKVSDEEILEFTEDIQETWWKENKDWFLKVKK